MESEPVKDRGTVLQDLASNSWNLEMIISGAAIFLVSYLPGLIDRLLWYYFENLASGPTVRSSTLPVLAYSFTKVAAWVLIGTFVIHFILRAFWVGLVGLHAVFPQGIQYDKLPWQSDFSQGIARKSFGQLSDYIHRLDRLSNQIFSLAFLVALMGLGISLIYLFIFLITNPNVFPAWMGDTKLRSLILLALVLVVALMPALAQWLSRRPERLKNPWMARFVNVAIRYAPALMLPLVYRPLSYINLIYTSNVPRRRLFGSLFLVTLVFTLFVMFVFAKTTMHLRGRDLFARQSFFGQNSNEFKLFSAHYDKMRKPDELLPAVSIPSDVVEGPVLRVFVSYRKWLDRRIEPFCEQPRQPAGISVDAWRTYKDSVNLDCLSRFFQLSVNDSVYGKIDWIFHTQPEIGSNGLYAYVPTAGFRQGKNILSVKTPLGGKADSLAVYGQIPFWYYGGQGE